jgi:serine protease Do
MNQKEKQSMSPTSRKKARWLTLGLVGLAGVGGAGYGLSSQSVTAQQQQPSVSAERQEKVVAQANSLSDAFRGSAERVMPAVVSIQHRIEPKLVQNEGRSKRGTRSGGQTPRGMDNLPPEIRRFFGDSFGGGDMEELFERGGSGGMKSPARESSGSGVIIDKTGIILTNNHVVAGGGKITVKLHDGREFVATEVKTDPSTDIAVIRVKTDEPLPYAALGNSDDLRIGDWVLALGQPFGLQDTVTAGIISAKGRNLGIVRDEEFLQTDAAINPGNSGGPLVNLRGEIIGINTAISSSSGGFQGVGFAVPVNVASWVSKQLLSDGQVHRAYLGVGIQPVNSELAEQFELDTMNGAVVTDVQPGSPAAEAGIKSQDVIVSFGGREIANHRQLAATVSRSPIGSKQPVVVMRDGKEVKLTVTVREQPKNFGVRAGEESDDSGPSEEQAAPSSFNKLGLEVGPLSGEVAQQLGLKQTAGVVITAVEEGSLAESAGLTSGMVVAQVGRKPVESVEQFNAAVKDGSLEKGILLLVKSTEGSRFVVLKSE